MIREKQDGEDLVFVAVDRTNAQSVTEAIRANGNTGKVTLAALACPGTLLQDTWDKIAADGSASATTTEHLIFRAAGNIVINSVEFIPDAALTANDTNYATLIISARNADGTNQRTVATVNTKTSPSGGSGNWAQWVAVNLAVTLANAALGLGQLLTIQINKAGSGVVVPWGSFAINYTLA